MSTPFTPATDAALTRESVMTYVREIAAEQFNIAIEDIKPTSSFTDDLGGDSLDAVEVAMHLEESFGIEVRDETLNAMVTVADAAQAVIEALADAGHPVAEGVA
jgi:acyl carrier protein